MKADLHNHSYYSDGVLSPKSVVEIASESGCDLFALTDHDTTQGLLEAEKIANKLSLNFIKGVEISSSWSNMGIHIVGLDIDDNSAVLQNGLQHNQSLRIERAEKIAMQLARVGISNAMEKTKALCKKDMLTRTHFAQMLIKEGYCKDMKSVFRRFLVGRKPGGVKVEWRDFKEVIHWIHSARGLAVLAHPLRYSMTNTKIKKMLYEFKEAGGDAVELVTANITKEQIALVSKWITDLNLMASCGSDFHGWANQRNKIGNLVDMPKANIKIWSRFACQ